MRVGGSALHKCVCARACVCVCASVSAFARVCVPSATRNARVPPKLRWLPSAKMAARIRPSDEREHQREKQKREERDIKRERERMEGV